METRGLAAENTAKTPKIARNWSSWANVRVTVEMDTQIFAGNVQLRESGDVNRAEFDAAFELLAE
jgi:hypothetical protein